MKRGLSSLFLLYPRN